MPFTGPICYVQESHATFNTAAAASDIVAAATEFKFVLTAALAQQKLFLSPVLFVQRSRKLYSDDVARMCRNKCFKDKFYAKSLLDSAENTDVEVLLTYLLQLDDAHETLYEHYAIECHPNVAFLMSSSR